jgi:hypothetical protein
MLREDEESFNLNQLWVVQGRLFIMNLLVLMGIGSISRPQLTPQFTGGVL